MLWMTWAISPMSLPVCTKGCLHYGFFQQNQAKNEPIFSFWIPQKLLSSFTTFHLRSLNASHFQLKSALVHGCFSWASPYVDVLYMQSITHQHISQYKIDDSRC